MAVPARAAPAQDGPDQRWVLRGQLGVTSYVGDHDESLASFQDGPLAAGFEIGYRTSDRVTVGTGYQFGRYFDIDGAEASAARHSLRLLLRYAFGDPAAGVAPYVQTGGQLTAGSAADGGEAPMGGGPLAGLGLSFALSPSTSFLLDATTMAAWPDDGVDRAGDGAAFSRDGTDFLTSLSAGLEIRFGSPAATPPEVVAVEGPTELDAGRAGQFTARASDAATPPVEYRWDWGDGTWATGLSSTHSYRRAGSYVVRFSASNEAGRDSRTMNVVVALPVNAPRVFSIWSDDPEIERGEEVQFRAYAGGAEPLEYHWDFGDGATGGEAAPLHAFAEPGRYEVALTVSNSEGSTREHMTVDVVPRLPRVTRAQARPHVVPVRGPAVRFEVDAEGDPPLRYRWDFGDGSGSEDATARHVYQRTGTYTARVTVENEGGATTETVRVVVNPTEPPEITAITTDRDRSQVDRVVRFSADIDGEGPLSYRWDFGDGGTARGATPTHVYTRAGTYDVVLVVRNGAGTDTRRIEVLVERP